MEIDLNFKFIDLDGKEFEEAQVAADALAQRLRIRCEPMDARKAWDIAKDLKKDKKIDLDGKDIDELKAVINKYPDDFCPTFVKAQILDAMVEKKIVEKEKGEKTEAKKEENSLALSALNKTA